MKRLFGALGVVLCVVACGYLATRYYSYLFARNISGKIVRVEKLNTPAAVIVTGAENSSPVLFAISIRDANGEIVTASTTDRQWAVAQPGYCAKVIFFRYPPWDMERSGTYFGVRLKKLYECGKNAG